MLRESVCALAFVSATSVLGQSTLKTRPAERPLPEPAAQSRAQAQPALAAAGMSVNTIPAGVPLRIEIDHTYSIKPGTRVEGHLIAPVYRVDHQVLPVNTRVSGVIARTRPVDSGLRTQAMLDGDFTPLAVADVQFDTLTLPGGSSVGITTHATERTSAVVRMGNKTKRPSLKDQAVDQMRQTKQDALDTITKPGKGDRLKRFLYAQLPYHPQRIWLGTEYDADLAQPLVLAGEPPPPLPVADLAGRTPTGHIEARLSGDIDSRSARQGQTVEAVLTRPLLTPAQSNSDRKVVLPEGTTLSGAVLQAKPAKWFARNGKLRFTFRQIELPEGSATAEVHGRITAAEANSSQNLSIDSEGGTKAGADKGKYLAPLALGVLAAASMDDDGNLAAKGAVAGNGFGLVARIVAITAANRNVTAGFAYFALAKSVYRRWIARGKDVSFPKDTRLEIDLSER